MLCTDELAVKIGNLSRCFAAQKEHGEGPALCYTPDAASLLPEVTTPP
jgi:hypothetical protein